MNKDKRSCKLSCATQLQVWYAVDRISLGLQFHCGEHLFWGGRKLIFLNKWLCLFELKQSATSLAFVLFICLGDLVRPNQATMLNASEITAASAACGGAPVIILTRAFWPGSEWRTKVEAVLQQPELYGGSDPAYMTDPAA